MDVAIPKTSFLFDLDGTLIDSVYQHVLAWREALDAERIDLSIWRIHRKIGMSGGLFASMLLRETGYHIDPDRIDGCEISMQRPSTGNWLASSPCRGPGSFFPT